MREVALFGEDRAHQLVVSALVRRLAEEHRVEVSLVWRQAYGGHGRMKHEFDDYLRALRRQREPLPDLIVAARDRARRETGSPASPTSPMFDDWREGIHSSVRQRTADLVDRGASDSTTISRQ